MAEKFWIKGVWTFAFPWAPAHPLVVWVESYDRPTGWKGVFDFPSASVHVYPYVLVYLGLRK